MQSAYLSTAYLAPVQYYCKLFHYPEIRMEACENFLKQTYRNRCTIAATNGPLSLSVPIVKPDTLKCLTKDIRISDHGNWRHLHWNALVSAYQMSPFFMYYEEDFAPFYEKKYTFLFDYNEALRQLICRLLDMQPGISYTESYETTVTNDFRETIRPKHEGEDDSFHPRPYYQVFQARYGFLPNLSIVDLLFNMGPEGLLVIRDSITEQASRSFKYSSKYETLGTFRSCKNMKIYPSTMTFPFFDSTCHGRLQRRFECDMSRFHFTVHITIGLISDGHLTVARPASQLSGTCASAHATRAPRQGEMQASEMGTGDRFAVTVKMFIINVIY